MRKSKFSETQIVAMLKDAEAAVIAALTDAVTRYPRWDFWKLVDRLRVEGRSWLTGELTLRRQGAPSSLATLSRKAVSCLSIFFS